MGGPKSHRVLGFLERPGSSQKEFDAFEGSQFSESGEASVTCSPGGELFYATWNQWDFENVDGELGEEDLADAIFRRVWFLDDSIPGETSSTGE